MEKCINCKYWEQNDDYNGNFGKCNCNKFAFHADLEDRKKHNHEEVEYDNYNLIYRDFDDNYADIRVHKEFGCINYENK